MSNAIVGTGLRAFRGHGSLKRIVLAGSLFQSKGVLQDCAMEYLADIPGLKGINVEMGDITDRGLSHITKLRELEYLNLGYTFVTDGGMRWVAMLGRLRFLGLEATSITDRGLQHLENLTELEMLWLAFTSVTDEGLKYLRNMKKLRFLDLRNCLISDAGVVHLAGLTNLEHLIFAARRHPPDYVPEAALTDASIPYLARLKKLKYLNLLGSLITEQGLAVLRKELPNCNVQHPELDLRRRRRLEDSQR